MNAKVCRGYDFIKNGALKKKGFHKKKKKKNYFGFNPY